MRHGRAGWHGFDAWDNAGEDSADTLIPELPHLAVGDVIADAMGPFGAEDAYELLDAVFTRRMSTGITAISAMPIRRCRARTATDGRSARRHRSRASWVALSDLRRAVIHPACDGWLVVRWRR